MPRKLGQHFLTSTAALARIAEAACGEFTPRVVEIGPGRGALTRHLLARTAELHAIELDPELAAALPSAVSGPGRLFVHHADVLSTDLAQWGPAAIVGNLPYYITSPIIEQFLRLDQSFHRAVFLIQQEVADRLRAAPGSRDYGFLTVVSRLFCQVEMIARVPPGAFSPPPKVDSAVVRLEKHAARDESRDDLIRFIGRCFAHKRKTLRNNLKGFYPPPVLAAAPESSLRAEQIPVDQFPLLFERLARPR